MFFHAIMLVIGREINKKSINEKGMRRPSSFAIDMFIYRTITQKERSRINRKIFSLIRKFSKIAG